MSKQCAPQTCQVVNGKCKFNGRVIGGVIHNCTSFSLACCGPKKLSERNPQFTKLDQCPCPPGPQGPQGSGFEGDCGTQGMTGPQGDRGIGITGPQGYQGQGVTGIQGPQGVGVTGTLFYVETSDSQTGPIIDGPFAITQNDTLRFWSAGGIEAIGEAGSALVQLEPNNILTSSGPPSDPPKDPTRPIIYVDSDTGEVYTWNPNQVSSSPTGPTGGVWNDPIAPTTSEIDSTLCEGGGINWEKLFEQRTYQNEFELNLTVIDGTGQTGIFDYSGFGEAVSISGDVWVVGAPRDGTQQKGLAHVYVGETLCQVVTPSQTNATGFGHQVAISGDYLYITDLSQNLDVYQRNPSHNRLEFSHSHLTSFTNLPETRLTASSPFYAVSHPSQNCVTIYHVVNNTTHKLSNESTNQSFGTSISLNSSRIAIGSPYGNLSQGEVTIYLYNSNNQAWEVEQNILSPTGATGSFGQSVALSNSNLAVSSPETQEVYVYGYNTSTQQWTLHTTLQNLNSPQSIALSGATLAISSPSINEVNIFQPSDSDPQLWTLKNTLTQSKTEYNQFGFAISLSGDKLIATSLTGDGLGGEPLFENFDSCANQAIPSNWTRDPDTINNPFWGCNSGRTPSNNGTITGPATDKSGSGSYVFLESSNSNPSLIRHLVLPELFLGGTFSFWYHMFGVNMGELHVDISTDGGSNWIEDVTPALVGQQQTAETDPWLQRTVDISSYAGNGFIRFRGIPGSSFQSDMAIDEVQLTPGIITKSAKTTYYCASPRVSNQTKQLYTLDYESGHTCWLDQTAITQSLSSHVDTTTSYQIQTTPSQTIPDFSDTLTLQMNGDCFQLWGTYLLDVTSATGETFLLNLPIQLPNGTTFPPSPRRVQTNTVSGSFQGKFSDNTPILGGITYYSDPSVPKFIFKTYATTASLPDTAEIQFQICGKLVKESILPILVTPTITNTCPSESNGSIQLEVFGNDPFTYVWSNGGTGPSIYNLSANDYEITITDSIGVQFNEIYTIETESPITNLQSDSITDTTADLSWTPGIPGTTEWDVTIGTVGFSPTDTPTDPGVTTIPYQAVGLTPSTTYEFYVREDCGGATGAWIGPSSSFTTLSPP